MEALQMQMVQEMERRSQEQQGGNTGTQQPEGEHKG